MAFFSVHATVTGSRYLGVIEASTPEEAQQKLESVEGANVMLCWQCAEKIEDPALSAFEVNEITESEAEGEPDAIEVAE